MLVPLVQMPGLALAVSSPTPSLTTVQLPLSKALNPPDFPAATAEQAASLLILYANTVRHSCTKINLSELDADFSFLEK